MIKRKKLPLLLGLLLVSTMSLSALTGREIIQKTEDTNNVSSTHSLVNLQIVDKTDKASSRVIEMFTTKNTKDETLSLIVFHSPASVKNTRFLSIENKGRDNDQWIYLPALKKVRRIAASEGNKSFMGTDLTYNDMGSRDIDNDTYTLKGEKTVNGRACYVVESVPKTSDGNQYSRRVSYVDKERFIPLKITPSILILILGIILLTGAGLLFADDAGFTSFADETAVSALSWSGTGSVTGRYMIDYNTPEDSGVILYPELTLRLDYNGESSEFTGNFTLSGNYDFTSGSDISRYLQKMIGEAYLRTFLSGFDIEAGYMKIVWGKGDEIFTFDNINAVDYSDFMNGSYVDRKIAEGMVKINIPFGDMGLIEALYTPVFTPDVFPTTGSWVQNDYKVLKDQLELMGKTPEETFKQEDTQNLKNGQSGFRITNSLGGIDLGATYEYTYLREPVVNMSAFLQDQTQKITVTYDRLHLFGIEAAAAPLGFNIRVEAAYYLTGDTDGTDPLVHNGRIQYLAGFDKDIPLHNLSINIQDRGEIKLNADKIKDNGQADTEYSDSESYTSNIIGADLRDTFINDTLTVKVSGAYTVGSRDYMIKPGIEYTLADSAVLKADYTIYRGDADTLFGQFKDNDMLEVVFQYTY